MYYTKEEITEKYTKLSDDEFYIFAEEELSCEDCPYEPECDRWKNYTSCTEFLRYSIQKNKKENEIMKYTKDEIISMYKNLSYNDFTNKLSNIKCGNCPFTNECTDYDFFHSDLTCSEIIREILNNRIVKEEKPKETKSTEKEENIKVILNTPSGIKFLTITNKQYELLEWLYDYQCLVKGIDITAYENGEQLNFNLT